jgi:hypothetical protein
MSAGDTGVFGGRTVRSPVNIAEIGGTGLDCAGPIPGYYDSPWPCECGGPRRQKAPRSPGLHLGRDSALKQRTYANGKWNVLTVLRAPGEMYLPSNNHIADVEKFGQVERIDPVSLAPLAASPRLPTGGHTWCTALVAHENGFLYLTNGNRCFKLDPDDCAVVTEATLPQDAPYNSLLVASDGRLIMKNLEHDTDRSTYVVVLDPDELTQVEPEAKLPENSMGRIAMDTVGDEQLIYVPGSHHFYRYRYDRAQGCLVKDDRWEPLYRVMSDQQQSFAWDPCLSGGGCWFLDNGDNEANTVIFASRPVGQHAPPRGSAFRGLATSAQKLIRVSVADGRDVNIFTPFGVARGSIFSPPAYDPIRGIAVSFDTGNGLLGAARYSQDGRFTSLWQKPCRISMQLLLFLDTAELVVKDFRGGRDNVVIYDLESGDEISRVATDSTTANGMFLSVGWNRDVIYCSIGSLARVWAEG